MKVCSAAKNRVSQLLYDNARFLDLARFRFAVSFMTAECGTDRTARNALSIRSAWSLPSQRAASSGGIEMGFGCDFISFQFMPQQTNPSPLFDCLKHAALIPPDKT